jgi:hypothetical protein
VTTSGFVVPEDYLKLLMATHSSQGLTANFAVVFGASFDQKAIYVSHSRARERVDTYVPSKEAFLARAERVQGERLGVLEAIADAKRKNGGPMHTNGFKAIASPGTMLDIPHTTQKLDVNRPDFALWKSEASHGELCVGRHPGD